MTALFGAVFLPLILGLSLLTVAGGAAIGAISAAGQYSIWHDVWSETAARDAWARAHDRAASNAATRRLGVVALGWTAVVMLLLGGIWLIDGHPPSPLGLFLLIPTIHFASVYVHRRRSRD